MLHCDIMDTPEYQDLFKAARLAYPYEQEYILQIACIKYLRDNGILKSADNIDNALQEISPT